MIASDDRKGGAAMTVFKALVAIAWLVLIYVSYQAVAAMGLAPAGTVFIEDFAHPWRAQFYTDFSLHILLVAAWILYREKRWWVGVPCAVLAGFCGGAFSLLYVLAAIFRAGNDPRRLLLGDRVPA
jgi:hypothetical protein